jgi:hypothetical protein
MRVLGVGRRRCTRVRHANRGSRTILVERGQAFGHTRKTALGAICRHMIIRACRKRAAYLIGRQVLKIGSQLLAQHPTYRELVPSYFGQGSTEPLTRRCLDQIRKLGFQTILTPLPTAA